MSKAGRRPYTIPRIPWKNYIRADLAAEIELLIADPMRGKPQYGARSKLLEQLLEGYLATVRRKARPSKLPAEPTELERLFNQLKFEVAHWNETTPERIKQLVLHAERTAQ